MKDVVVVERATANDKGQRFHVRNDKGLIAVTWPCGASRAFSKEAIEDIVACLTLLAGYQDVWLKGRDFYGSDFFARIRSGDLIVVEALDDDSVRVSWDTISKMLEKASE